MNWRNNLQNETVGYEFLNQEYPSRAGFTLAEIENTLDRLEAGGKLELSPDGTIKRINDAAVRFTDDWRCPVVIESTRKTYAHKEQNSWTEYQTWFRRYRDGTY